jgi:hypothetical protein
MTQPMIATLIAVGVVAIAFLAVLGLMRPKRITLVDYPELPAPPKDETAAAGTDHAGLSRSSLKDRRWNNRLPDGFNPGHATGRLQ